MKHAVLMLVCAFTLCSCGMFGKSEPRHMTTAAEWEKYGYRDHLQDTGQITSASTSKTDNADVLNPQKNDAKDDKKTKKKKKAST